MAGSVRKVGVGRKRRSISRHDNRVSSIRRSCEPKGLRSNFCVNEPRLYLYFNEPHVYILNFSILVLLNVDGGSHGSWPVLRSSCRICRPTFAALSQAFGRGSGGTRKQLLHNPL